MKAVLLVYNQAHSEKVLFMLDKLEIRGYTKWEDVVGRGSETGVPHMGTHTWPEQNAATLAVINDELVKPLLDTTKNLDAINEEIGIRAFIWEITAAY